MYQLALPLHYHILLRDSWHLTYFVQVNVYDVDELKAKPERL